MLSKQVAQAKKILLLISLTLLVLMFSSVQSKAQSSLDQVQNLVQRWVTLEQQNSALISDWQKQRTMLVQRQGLFANEKAQLQNILENSSTDTDLIEQQRIELLEVQNSMEQDQRRLKKNLQTALQALQSMQAQLPPPLQSSWEEKLLRLSPSINTSSLVPALDENIEVTDDNLSQGLQIVLELLTELDDFQSRISINEAPITFKDKSVVLVKQLYLGAAHGWYVSPDGLLSGYGHSTPAGWEWLENFQVDGEILLSAIAMLERNINVALVTLPLELSAPVQTMPFTPTSNPNPLFEERSE